MYFWCLNGPIKGTATNSSYRHSLVRSVQIKIFQTVHLLEEISLKYRLLKETEKKFYLMLSKRITLMKFIEHFPELQASYKKVRPTVSIDKVATMYKALNFNWKFRSVLDVANIDNTTLIYRPAQLSIITLPSRWAISSVFMWSLSGAQIWSQH